MSNPHAVINTLFMSIEGEYISRYVARQQLERDKRLLTEDWNEYSTTDISIDLGYNSPGAFCTDFKKIIGIILTVYRYVGMRDRKIFQS